MSRVVSRSSLVAGSRRGVSLAELVIAMTIASVLMLAMGSALMVSTRAIEIGQDGPEARTAEAARVLERITSELRLALRFSVPLDADSITVTVPDTDGDGQPETVKYAWSGAPDYTLIRQVHLSRDASPLEPVVLAEDVRDFDLSYVLRRWGSAPPPTLLESEEVLLMAHDDAPGVSGTRALFVVTDAGAPTPQEELRRWLMVSWGYTVLLIGASEPQTSFDAATGVTDVAYISEEIDADELGTKLRDTGIGVVNEAVELVDELGVAGSFGFPPPASVLDVTSATHFVTSAFMPGAVSLFTATQPVTNITATPEDQAPGLDRLGGWSGLPALVLLESGAELHDVAAGFGTVGHDTVFGNQKPIGEFDTKHVATQVVLSTGATVTSIAAYLYMKADKTLRFGVYEDDGGEPGVLLGQTLAVKLPKETTQWHTLDMERPLALQPGTYWLALGMQKDVGLHFDPAGGETRYSDADPNDGLMESWTDTYGPDPNHERVSIYANYTETSFAAGRRVILPWGGDAFDFDALGDDGRTIMQRSLAWAADTTPGDASEPFFILKQTWPAQYFLPPLPINAVGWKLTRLLVVIRSDPRDTGGKVRFQLRHADTSLQPTPEIVQETAEIPVSTWDPYEYTWYEIPFTPVEDLNPQHGVCLVITGKDNENAVIKIDRGGRPPTPGTHFMETDDEGTSWTLPENTADMRFYLYGTYTTSGEPAW